MPQDIKPSIDGAIGGWTDDGGGSTDIFTAVSESVVDDNTYIITGNNPSADTVIFTGSAVAEAPDTGSTHTLTWRYRDTGGARVITLGLRVFNISDDTTIVQRTAADPGSTVVEDVYTLSGSEVSSIVDYSDIGFSVTANTSGGGSPDQGVVTYINFQVPDAPTPPPELGVMTFNVGDFIVRKNLSNTDTIPDAGSLLKLKWDTEVTSSGHSIVYSGSGDFLVSGSASDTGSHHYLMTYSEHMESTSSTSNEELSIRTSMYVNDIKTHLGTYIAYIPKINGAQSYINQCACVFTASVGDKLSFMAQRHDQSTTGAERPRRVAGDRSGVTFIRLDDTWQYSLYKKTSDETVNSGFNGISAIQWDEIIEEGTSVKLLGGGGNTTIGYSTGSAHLMFFNLILRGGSGNTDFQCRINYLAGGNTGDLYDDTFFNHSNGCDYGALNGKHLWIPDAGSGSNYTVDTVSRTSSPTMTVTSGSSLQLVQLPPEAQYFKIRDSSPSTDINAAGVEVTWTTEVYTHNPNSFDFNSPSVDMNIATGSDFLFFNTLRQGSGYGAGTGVFAVPASSFMVDDVEIEYGGVSAFNQGATNLDHASTTNCLMIPAIASGSTVSVYMDRLGTNTDTMNNLSHQTFAGVNLGHILNPTEVGAVNVLQLYTGVAWDSINLITEVSASNLSQYNGVTL